MSTETPPTEGLPTETPPSATPSATPPSATPPLTPMPGLESVGHGVYLRPGAPYELKDILFERDTVGAYYSEETATNHALPEGYLVDNSPPMPAAQAMNQVVIEESWDRFEKRTSMDASAAVSSAPFSVDVTASQTSELRQEEDCYYAMRTSLVPLWTIYIPNASRFANDGLDDVNIPVPFSHSYRQEYARVFDYYGTHYVRRVWVGGKATLALVINKSSQMTVSDIQAGIKASSPGAGSAGLSTSDQQSKAKLQSNSRCTVFGTGGNELKLAAMNTLDEDLFNEWLVTIGANPQVIAFDAIGIWTLLRDPAKAEALKAAYIEETVFSTLRVVFNLDGKIHLFEDFEYYTFDFETGVTTKPQRIQDTWGELYTVGFERVDAAFLGKYLRSTADEDLSRKLFMFNRDMYVRWDVDGHKIDPGYPKPIKEGWPGIDFPRVDAVVNVSPDAVYFFYGGQYTRFNTINNRADDGYPLSVSQRWTGVTFDRIDAATYWRNGKVYFFNSNQYIRYDTVTWRADPGYPKSIVSHYVEDWRFFE